MTIQYCEDKICKKGGAFYYALRKIPHDLREAIICIQAFYQEILDSLFDCHDAAISRARLNWWRDEVDRAFKQEATHPVAIALQITLKKFPLNKKLFFSIINGMESYLDYPVFETQTEAFQFFSQFTGSRELLFLHLVDEIKGHEHYAYQLGTGLEIIHQLRHLKRVLDKGHFFFSQDVITPENFAFEALKKEADIARNYLTQARKIKLKNNALQKFNTARICLAMTLLNELEKENFPVMITSIHLNPIRKLFVGSCKAK